MQCDTLCCQYTLMGSGFFVVFFYLVMIVSRIISATVSKTYREQKDLQIMWDTYAVSSFHAPFSALMAFLSLTIFSDDNPGTDLKTLYLRASTFQIFLLSWTLGYTLLDFIIVAVNFKIFKDWSTIIHHLVLLFAYVNGLCQPFGAHIMCCLQISEATTVSGNLRWFLDKCGRKDTRFYLYNALSWTFLFFAIRVGYITYIVVNLCITAPYDLVFSSPIRTIIFAMAPLFLLMQYYWAHLIYKGLVSYMRKTSTLKQQ